jgi:hypothetical protein
MITIDTAGQDYNKRRHSERNTMVKKKERKKERNNKNAASKVLMIHVPYRIICKF